MGICLLNLPMELQFVFIQYINAGFWLLMPPEKYEITIELSSPGRYVNQAKAHWRLFARVPLVGFTQVAVYRKYATVY
jgi:hypothetical protein